MKILNDQGIGSASDLVAALDWVAAYGQRPAVALVGVDLDGAHLVIERSVGAAADAGVVVVVAAGDNSEDACNYSPASATAAITVGAASRTGERLSFSNWGSCVDLWAPGRISASAARRAGGAVEAAGDGTSAASAHAAGAAALVLGVASRVTPQQVLQALRRASPHGVLHLERLTTLPRARAPPSALEAEIASVAIPVRDAGRMSLRAAGSASKLRPQSLEEAGGDDLAPPRNSRARRKGHQAMALGDD